MMYCNNLECDFEFDDTKEKTPMACPKCKHLSFGRPKGYDPFRYVHYCTVYFPGGWISAYGRYLVMG